MENEQPIVRCVDLVKRYRDVTAVDGLSVEVRAGECVGLLGPNGAGKTTTVEIIEGLTRPDGGIVELFGARWGRGRDRALRERIGVQLQKVELQERLTVAETVRLFRSFFRRGRTIDEAVALAGLEAKRDAQVRRLSGGQKQRLALACALVGAPDLLCLDEPTTGLDPQARLRLWEVVEHFKSGGGTVLLTTHYMEEAARLCDRVAIIDAGQVIASDTPPALVRRLGADQLVEFEAPTGCDAAALEALPGVVWVRAQGDRRVVSVQDVGAALPVLLRELDRQGVTLRTLTTYEPTLEDVFVHLTGRGLRDG